MHVRSRKAAIIGALAAALVALVAPAAPAVSAPKFGAPVKVTPDLGFGY